MGHIHETKQLLAHRLRAMIMFQGFGAWVWMIQILAQEWKSISLGESPEIIDFCSSLPGFDLYDLDLWPWNNIDQCHTVKYVKYIISMNSYHEIWWICIMIVSCLCFKRQTIIDFCKNLVWFDICDLDLWPWNDLGYCHSVKYARSIIMFSTYWISKEIVSSSCFKSYRIIGFC